MTSRTADRAYVAAVLRVQVATTRGIKDTELLMGHRARERSRCGNSKRDRQAEENGIAMHSENGRYIIVGPITRVLSSRGSEKKEERRKRHFSVIFHVGVQIYEDK